jgi:hypothetical protein
MYYSNEDKKQIYNRWLQNGRPWFDIDASKEPTYAEKQVILEMLKRENSKIKRELDLEKRTKQFRVYEKKGMIRDTIFDGLGNY